MTKTNIKKGDTIYHLSGMLFKVIDIVDGEFPIKVRNEMGDIIFINLNVNVNKYGVHIYYIQKPKIVGVKATYYVRPDIKIDTLVEVWDYSKKDWKLAYFANFTENDGEIEVFSYGASSLTSDGRVKKVHKFRFIDGSKLVDKSK